MNRRTLIFGATGMLGRAVTREATATGGADMVAMGSAECDVTKEEEVLRTVRTVQPAIIVNCAAYTAVDAAEDAAEAADRLNHVAPRNIATAAKEADATLIHISTDYVFDGNTSRPYREDDATHPLSVYGKTKLDGEKAIAASGCRHIVVRTQWLYATWGKNFLLTMLRLFGERTSVGVVSDQWGTPTYVGNVARTVATIAKRYRPGLDGVYHYADAGKCCWYDFAATIAEMSGAKCRIEPIKTGDYPTKAVRPPYSVLDTEKVAQTFGIEPPQWQESLATCLEELGYAPTRRAISQSPTL